MNGAGGRAAAAWRVHGRRAAAALAITLLATVAWGGQSGWLELPAGTRAPYLLLVAPGEEWGASGLALAWRAASPGPARVRIEPLDGARPPVSLDPGRPGPDGTAWVGLAGLTPGARYRYTVTVDRRLASPPAVFRAPPVPGAGRLRVVVLGDTGTGGGAQKAVAEVSTLEAPDLVLHLGDVVYPAGSDAAYDHRFFGVYGRLLADVPWLVVPGNHDVKRDGGAAFHRAFLGRGVAVPGRHAVGPLEILALDSTRVDSGAQTAWLAAATARPPAPGTWRIAILHHPPRSTTHRGGAGEAVRARWVPLLAAGGVSLLVAGHDHRYERLPAGPSGLVQVVAGGGGARLYAAGEDEPADCVAVAHGLLVLDVTPDRLVGKALDSSGRLLDRFVLTRAGRPALPRGCAPDARAAAGASGR